MPFQFRHVHSSKHIGVLHNCIEDFLSLGCGPSSIQASKYLKRWKFATWQIVETWSSPSSEASTSQPEDYLTSFACATDSDDSLASGTNRDKGGPMSLPSLFSLKRRPGVFGLSSVANRPALNKQFPHHGCMCCCFSTLSWRELQKHGMHGWDQAMVQIKDEQRCTHLWGSGVRTHMGHAHDHSHEMDGGAGGAGEKVLKLGLLADILLSVCKGAAGYVSGSTAIIADAAHSVSDIVLSGVALWTSKASKAPKDKEHPYGHGKIETMGALTISSLLLLTGGGIAWNAAETLQVLLPAMSDIHLDSVIQSTVDTIQKHTHSHGHDHEHGVVGHHHGLDLEHMGVALCAAVVSIGVKEGLYWITRAAGEKAGSALLKANAWHHRSDAISSVVALIGVGGAMLGIPLLDPVAALFVSGMIVKAGLETGYQSMQELLDKGLPDSVLVPIRKTVLQVEGVEGIHQLRGRRMGSSVHLDVHIEVDPWLSVSAAHNIGEAVRQQVHKHHPNVTESFVHIDPADGRPAAFTPGKLEDEIQDSAKQPRDHHQDKQSHVHNHSHDHQKAIRVEGGEKHGDLHLQRDLTRIGSKADLLESMSSDSRDGHGVFRDNVDTLQQSEVERVVRYVLDANFHKTAKVRHVTCHFLQGKVVVEVGVSLNLDLSVRDAIQRANDMRTCLIRNVPDISAVSVQLKLS